MIIAMEDHISSVTAEPTAPARSGRSANGGRAARVAARAAPLPDNMRPVRAGMPGGQYKPLTDAGISQIHTAALDALETIGLSQAPASGVELMTKAGAILGDDGRLRFPRALVEDMVNIAARDITLFGRDEKYDLHLTGTNVHFGTAGAAVHIVDPITHDYRESTAQDLYDAARLTQNLDNVHFFNAPWSAVMYLITMIWISIRFMLVFQAPKNTLAHRFQTQAMWLVVLSFCTMWRVAKRNGVNAHSCQIRTVLLCRL